MTRPSPDAGGGIDAFFSDPHFGHKNIIRYAERPFGTLGEMHRELIARYNRVVGLGDTCLWTGDCFFGGFEESREILSKLNGRKLLVLGNHDRGAGRMAEMGFALATDTLMMHIAGRTVRVCHYPYWGATEDTRYPERRPPKYKGEVLIHGHTHSKKKREGNMIHVGVDAWDFTPARYDEVAQLVARA